MSGYHRPRRQNSHQQSYGAPPYDTASQGQRSSGFEDFSALQDPTIYEDTWAPAGHESQLDPLHQSPTTNAHPGYTASFPQQNVVAGSLHTPHYSQYSYYPQPSTAIQGPQSPVNASGFQTAYATGSSVSSLTSPSYVNAGYGAAPPPGLPYAASAASSTTSQPEEEEGLRPTADEEKRKRNLAASARFRQKKKLREQQLEQATRELSERAAELEERIAELEQENQLLKAMLTEKEENMTEEDKRRFRQIASQMEDY